MFNPAGNLRLLPGVVLLSLGFLTLHSTATAVPAKPSDFNGDGKTDIAVFHRGAGTPGQASWKYVTSCSSASVVSTDWGVSTDRPVPGNYVENSVATNEAIVRPGPYGLEWWVNGLSEVQVFGLNTDLPVPRDYFGDGNVYPATVRSSSGHLVWYLYDEEINDYLAFLWGLDYDKPVPADYDGDGKAEAAVFRPSDGIWYILRVADMSPTYVSWGLRTDKPVPGDYDGDGKYDVAVFRPSDGVWYIRKSSDSNPMYVTWGASTDIPVPGDYDGDGKFDVAVFRPSTTTWYILYSAGGQCTRQFGDTGDTPVPALYNPD
jgi:hypothetical protein